MLAAFALGVCVVAQMGNDGRFLPVPVAPTQQNGVVALPPTDPAVPAYGNNAYPPTPTQQSPIWPHRPAARLIRFSRRCHRLDPFYNMLRQRRHHNSIQMSCRPARRRLRALRRRQLTSHARNFRRPSSNLRGPRASSRSCPTESFGQHVLRLAAEPDRRLRVVD